MVEKSTETSRSIENNIYKLLTSSTLGDILIGLTLMETLSQSAMISFLNKYAKKGINSDYDWEIQNKNERYHTFQGYTHNINSIYVEIMPHYVYFDYEERAMRRDQNDETTIDPQLKPLKC